jgi:DNA-binding transcriptional ArsR family regulator
LPKTKETIQTSCSRHNDPRRLAILRLLKRRSWFSKELADELKLTPATVSYHMDMLFKAELIRIEHTGGRRYYYTLNAKGMKKLIEGLRQEFLEDPGM